MSFDPRTVVIYSVGLLGSSIGLSLKTSDYSGRIIGLSSPANLKEALDLGCIDEGMPYDALPKAVAHAEALFLCSPIHVILETIETLGRLDLPPDLLITDVGSTKQVIVDKAQAALPAHVCFVGGHPMAGSEKSGAQGADPYLFQNALWVLARAQNQVREVDRQFAAFLERHLGCKHAFLDPATHDLIAATVSHVPHLLAVSLVNLAGRMETQVPGTLNLAAGGFRDMTRIASASYRMWNDIFATNKGSIAPVLDMYIELLEEVKDRLRQDALAADFSQAADTRAKVPLRNKGFINPLSEVLVLAKDRPGFIAAMAAALAETNINIKDFEVLKVREGEGGTFRLAFENHETADRAVRVLRAAGFSARERE